MAAIRRLVSRRRAGVMAQVNVEIVRRSDHAKGFLVLPKRWVVERTFASLGRCRRSPRLENSHRRCLSSYVSPPSGSCSGSYGIQHDLSGQTLRMRLIDDLQLHAIWIGVECRISLRRSRSSGRDGRSSIPDTLPALPRRQPARVAFAPANSGVNPSVRRNPNAVRIGDRRGLIARGIRLKYRGG